MRRRRRRGRLCPLSLLRKRNRSILWFDRISSAPSQITSPSPSHRNRSPSSPTYYSSPSSSSSSSSSSPSSSSPPSSNNSASPPLKFQRRRKLCNFSTKSNFFCVHFFVNNESKVKGKGLYKVFGRRRGYLCEVVVVGVAVGCERCVCCVCWVGL